MFVLDTEYLLSVALIVAGEEVLSMNVRGDGRLDMEEQEMVLTQAVLAIDHYYAPEDPYF